ncbi:hypothetical protein HYW83_01440 [Candidatus Peregrinibacteria bacterium]|nr:hypothetical protein [Candidatus Peregrinibacteria bacterium]
MLLPWAILILAALGLLILFSILRFQALQIERRADILKDALWARRNRIPLLLEVIQRAGSSYAKRTEVIQIREKVLSEAYGLEEQIQFERQLSQHIAEIFRAGLKSDSLYLSLQKEMNELLKSIQIAINDYNRVLTNTIYSRRRNLLALDKI